MTMTKFTVNPAAMNELLKGPNGPIATHLYKRGRRVEAFAKRNVDNPRQGAKQPRRRSGDLYNSIFTTYPAIDQGELAVVVGSDQKHNGVDYPFLLEKGGTARFTFRRGPQRGKRGTKAYKYPWLLPALASEFERG